MKGTDGKFITGPDRRRQSTLTRTSPILPTSDERETVRVKEVDELPPIRECFNPTPYLPHSRLIVIPNFCTLNYKTPHTTVGFPV